MGPGAWSTDSNVPLKWGYCIGSSGHQETGGEPEPRRYYRKCNYYKKCTVVLAVALAVVSLCLIAVIVLADIPMATKGSYRTGEFDREFVGGRRNKISMVRKGLVASVNTAPGSSICNFVLTENLIMDASTQVLVWICRDCGLHFPIIESQARGTIWCDRCLLVESLRKQVGELQEEVARLRSIHTHEEFIENMHMETSKVEEQSSGRGLH